MKTWNKVYVEDHIASSELLQTEFVLSEPLSWEACHPDEAALKTVLFTDNILVKKNMMNGFFTISDNITGLLLGYVDVNKAKDTMLALTYFFKGHSYFNFDDARETIFEMTPDIQISELWD